jgi:hypothetical protein
MFFASSRLNIGIGTLLYVWRSKPPRYGLDGLRLVQPFAGMA